MRYLFLMLSLFLTMTVNAATLSAELGKEFDLNKASPNMMLKHSLGSTVVKHHIIIAAATYDFAKLGGAQTTLTLKGDNGQPVVLPNKALIVGCFIDVQTPLTTGSAATMSISTGQTGADLKPLTAAASYTGIVACVPVGTAATAIKLTADRTMTVTVAVGTITAGKFTVFVQYIMGRN